MACVGLSVFVPLQASAAGSPVKLSRVQYDSPGSDTGSNTNVNGEWARIKNSGSQAVKLTG